MCYYLSITIKYTATLVDSNDSVFGRLEDAVIHFISLELPNMQGSSRLLVQRSCEVGLFAQALEFPERNLHLCVIIQHFVIRRSCSRGSVSSQDRVSEK